MPRADRRPHQFSTLIAAQRFALAFNPLGFVKRKTLIGVSSNRATRLPKLSAAGCCTKTDFYLLGLSAFIRATSPLIVLFGGPFALSISA